MSTSSESIQTTGSLAVGLTNARGRRVTGRRLVALAAAMVLVSACGAGDGKSATATGDKTNAALAGAQENAVAGATTITVTHGPAPAPTYLDLGAPGASVGDERIFHFDAQSDAGTVQTDWIMTTTAVDAPEPGVETRVTSATFAFGGLDNTISFQGPGWYPGKSATFKVSATLVRAITGGTGKYRGAGGWVESTHNADDSWTHVLHFD